MVTATRATQTLSVTWFSTSPVWRGSSTPQEPPAAQSERVAASVVDFARLTLFRGLSWCDPSPQASLAG